MASQPAQLLQALKFTRGDLSIKIGEAWQRLASPSGDNKFNCHNVVFDDGITVSQVNKTTGGICTIKFSVETPATIVLDEADEHLPLSVEAKCLEIGELELDCSKPEKAPGIEDARRFALANLDRNTAVIKLAGLTKGNSNRKAFTQEAISQQIAALLVGKARGTAANDDGVYGYSTMSQIIDQMKSTSGPNRDLPELVVRGKNVSCTTQPPTQQQPLEVRQQVSSSPASKSQNDDWEREKQRHRERLARELEHLEIEQRRQCEKTREASNARRAAAIAALNAYYDEMLQEELAGLPIETDIEEARRALEDWN